MHYSIVTQNSGPPQSVPPWHPDFFCRFPIWPGTGCDREHWYGSCANCLGHPGGWNLAGGRSWASLSECSNQVRSAMGIMGIWSVGDYGSTWKEDTGGHPTCTTMGCHYFGSRSLFGISRQLHFWTTNTNWTYEVEGGNYRKLKYIFGRQFSIGILRNQPTAGSFREESRPWYHSFGCPFWEWMTVTATSGWV